MENQVQNTANNIPAFIPATENQDLTYWTNEFGISREELEETISAGGSPAIAVENYVKKIQYTA